MLSPTSDAEAGAAAPMSVVSAIAAAAPAMQRPRIPLKCATPRVALSAPELHRLRVEAAIRRALLTPRRKAQYAGP